MRLLRMKIIAPIVGVIVAILLFLSMVGYRAAVPDVNSPDDTDNDGIPNEYDNDDDNNTIPDDQQPTPPPQQPTAYGVASIPIVIKWNLQTAGLTAYIGTDPMTPFVPISISDYVDESTGQLMVWKKLSLLEAFPSLPPTTLSYPRIDYWVEVDIVEVATQQHLTWKSIVKTDSQFKTSDVISETFESGRFFFYNQGSYVLTAKLYIDYYAVAAGGQFFEDPMRMVMDTITYNFVVNV
jgi:hypothetical protein